MSTSKSGPGRKGGRKGNPKPGIGDQPNKGDIRRHPNALTGTLLSKDNRIFGHRRPGTGKEQDQDKTRKVGKSQIEAATWKGPQP